MNIITHKPADKQTIKAKQTVDSQPSIKREMSVGLFNLPRTTLIDAWTCVFDYCKHFSLKDLYQINLVSYSSNQAFLNLREIKQLKESCKLKWDIKILFHFFCIDYLENRLRPNINLPLIECKNGLKEPIEKIQQIYKNIMKNVFYCGVRSFIMGFCFLCFMGFMAYQKYNTQAARDEVDLSLFSVLTTAILVGFAYSALTVFLKTFDNYEELRKTNVKNSPYNLR